MFFFIQKKIIFGGAAGIYKFFLRAPLFNYDIDTYSKKLQSRQGNNDNDHEDQEREGKKLNLS